MRHLTILSALLLVASAGLPARAAGAEPGADAANGYSIETTGSTQKLARGAKGKLVFTIRPRSGWHIDPRTPLRIDLSAPAGLKLDKERLGKEDAVTPKTAEAPSFQGAFTAVSPGTHDAHGKLDFFVCSANACVKQVRDVAVPVTVQ